MHRSSEFALAKESFDQKMARQQAVLDKLSPERLIADLAASAQDLDTEVRHLGIANSVIVVGRQASH